MVLVTFNHRSECFIFIRLHTVHKCRYIHAWNHAVYGFAWAYVYCWVSANIFVGIGWRIVGSSCPAEQNVGSYFVRSSSSPADSKVNPDLYRLCSANKHLHKLHRDSHCWLTWPLCWWCELEEIGFPNFHRTAQVVRNSMPYNSSDQWPKPCAIMVVGHPTSRVSGTSRTTLCFSCSLRWSLSAWIRIWYCRVTHQVRPS